MAYFLQKKYLQKPRQWGPLSNVRSGVNDWCESMLGVGPPAVFLPLLEGAGSVAHDVGTTGCDFAVGAYAVWNGDGLRSADATFENGSYMLQASAGSVPALLGAECCFWIYGANRSVYSTTGYYTLYTGTNDRYYFTASNNSGSNLYSIRLGDGSTTSVGGKPFVAGERKSLIYQWDNSSGSGSDGEMWEDNAIIIDDYAYTGLINQGNPISIVYASNTVSVMSPTITAIFSQKLKSDQIALLYDNPYGAIQPRAMPIYSFASEAAGSTYQLTADGGSYAVSGADAGLLRSARLEASGGSLSISGTAASLLFSRLIDASSGSFLLTGADAELRSNRYMLADNGAFALTGSDVTLTYTPVGAYILTADGGSFVLTGSDTNLLHDLVLTADGGSFSISGAAAGLVFDRVMSAAGGSYALTGSEAALTYTQAGTYILTCDAGSFALSGSGVDLLRDYIMPVEPGSYALSGSDAGLLLSRMLAASGGAFTLTGADADFLRDYNLVCDGGTYTLTGSDVTLTYSGYELPSGKMSITFAIKQPGVFFSKKTPGITFTVN